MILYHATPECNRASISTHGLDPILAQTRAKVIWLVTAELQNWAVRHCKKRHHVGPNDAVLLYAVRVKRRMVEEQYDGRWWCYQVIDPTSLKVVAQYGPGDIIIV